MAAVRSEWNSGIDDQRGALQCAPSSFESRRHRSGIRVDPWSREALSREMVARPTRT